MPPPRKRPSKPFRKQPRLPLDPEHLVQRPLADPVPPLPVAELKSPTRHPTVFRKRLAHVDQQARHGDILRVVSGEGIVGYGTWNPRAEATLRILRWGEAVPDENWWRDRLEQAVRLRRDVLQLDRSTNACRLINAEGDGFPGLVADQLGEFLSLQAFTLAMYQRAEAIAGGLKELTGARDWVVRTGPNTFEQEGFLAEGFVSGAVPEKIIIEEHDLLYEIRIDAGHKTGFFCDQRENRLRLREFCRGKSVLDLCCYSGGFALNAARGGAADVTGVELDEEAVRMARRNAQIEKAPVKFVHADAFSYMRDMQRNGRRYDVVVLDPPKLIRHRDEETEGRNKYFDLNQLAASLVVSGGLLLTCSCSGLLSADEFTRTVRAATAERSPRLLLRSGAGMDHPVAMNCLETEYLKCLWLEVGR